MSFRTLTKITAALGIAAILVLALACGTDDRVPAADAGRTTADTGPEIPLAVQTAPSRSTPAPGIESSLMSARIATASRLALLETFGAAAEPVEIRVDDYHVTLSGTVGDRTVQATAADAIRSVEGVDTVDNRLALDEDAPVPTVDPADAILATEVKLALLDNAGSAALAVDVDATDGVVEIAGVGDDPELEAMLVETARRTDGVRRVRGERTTG